MSVEETERDLKVVLCGPRWMNADDIKEQIEEAFSDFLNEHRDYLSDGRPPEDWS